MTKSFNRLSGAKKPVPARPATSSRKRAAGARTTLLRWYQRNGRVLPWRMTADPYAIWISEVMLQQTQVSRVIPYYERFLRRFPSVNTLSGARWRELLPYWRGLGYYQRGKNLLLAASTIVTRHGGAFPKETAVLQTIPGIGPYTAAAIASFAFGEPVPAIDTNIRRVLQRVLGCSPDEVPAAAAQFFRGAGAQGSALNQALMDLGAGICRSRTVLCESCPIRAHCAFALSGAPLEPRERESRIRVRPEVHVGAACIRREEKFLVALRSSGEWEFPGGKREDGEDLRHCLKREIREELGIEISVRPAFHLTDFEKNGVLHRIHFCRSQILRGVPRPVVHRKLRWVTKSELSSLKLAQTNREAAAILSGSNPVERRNGAARPTAAIVVNSRSPRARVVATKVSRVSGSSAGRRRMSKAMKSKDK